MPPMHLLRSNMPKGGGLFLKDDWMSLTQNFQMQSITKQQQSNLSTQYIDQVVDTEMKRVKANCQREEEQFVEQMLLENPIVVERRSLSPVGQSTQSTVPTVTTDSTPKTNDDNYQLLHSAGNGCSSNYSNRPRHRDANKAATLQQLQLQQQQQRAESCRRSRINNKIKKAKMKFRHKFMSNKLMQSISMLKCIQKLIDQAEMQLQSQGYPQQQLEKIKELYCGGGL
uniref:BZIP domain-containing protein n=1 Tax=Stomoxys calcitrans TaxID=35570 RepID=A0A1I8PHK5_STOCA